MSIDIFKINTNDNNYLETATINQGLEYKEKQNRLINLANNKNTYFGTSNESLQSHSLIESFKQNNDVDTNTGASVATLPPKAITPNVLSTITQQIMSSTDPAVIAQQQNYQNLLNKFNSIQSKYQTNTDIIHQDTKDYIDTTSPTNGYLNSFIINTNGDVFYVTNRGLLRYVPNMDIFNSISGKNGCPKMESAVRLTKPLIKSSTGNFMYTQQPDTKAVFNIKGIYSADTNMNKLDVCGKEGKNVLVNSLWDSPYSTYQATYHNWDINDGTKFNYHSGNNYDLKSCMNQAIRDGNGYFGLTNYNMSSGLSDCITMDKTPENAPDQKNNSVCSNMEYRGFGKNASNVDGNSRIYGKSNGVALYQTPDDSIGSVHFVGVFADSPNRALPLVNDNGGLSNFWGGDYNHNYENCLKYAAGGNRDGPGGSPVKYKYFSLQDAKNGGNQTQCGVSNVENPLQGYARYGQIKSKGVGTMGKDGHIYAGANQFAVYNSQSGDFLGLYGDGPAHAVANFIGGKIDNRVNTYDKCRKFAIANNQKYFGLQNFDSDKQVSQCWVTDDDNPKTGYPKYGRLDTGSTNIPGTIKGPGANKPNLNPVGLPNPVYGGGWQNSVYAIDYINSKPESYLGCYNKYPNTGSLKELSSNSSFEDCKKRAQDQNYQYFGISNIDGNYPNTSKCYGTNNPKNLESNGISLASFTNKQGDNTGNLHYTSTYKVGGDIMPSYSLVGRGGYIDDSGYLYRYSPSSKLTNNYQKYPNTDSEVFGYLNKHSSQVDCQTYCNDHTDCTGYLYDNSDNKCVLKYGTAEELLSRMKKM
jgi:hypothetical protein